MNPRLIWVFQDQVRLQCEFILRAASEISVALATPSAGTATAVFYSIQSLLTAAANVSKALWGAKEGLAEARQP